MKWFSYFCFCVYIICPWCALTSIECSCNVPITSSIWRGFIELFLQCYGIAIFCILDNIAICDSGLRAQFPELPLPAGILQTNISLAQQGKCVAPHSSFSWRQFGPFAASDSRPVGNRTSLPLKLEPNLPLCFRWLNMLVCWPAFMLTSLKFKQNE